MCYVGKATKIFTAIVSLLLVIVLVIGFVLFRHRDAHGGKSNKCSSDSCAQSTTPVNYPSPDASPASGYVPKSLAPPLLLFPPPPPSNNHMPSVPDLSPPPSPPTLFSPPPPSDIPPPSIPDSAPPPPTLYSTPPPAVVSIAPPPTAPANNS